MTWRLIKKKKGHPRSGCVSRDVSFILIPYLGKLNLTLRKKAQLLTQDSDFCLSQVQTTKYIRIVR